MHVAVVGSRKDADRDQVESFVSDLWAKYPDTILVSGGADGVDKWAETKWIELGGRVISIRVHQEALDRHVIQQWRLGAWEKPEVHTLLKEPVWSNRESALIYRDSIIAELSDKVVAFFCRARRTMGTQITLDFAYAFGRDTYEYFAHA